MGGDHKPGRTFTGLVVQWATNSVAIPQTGSLIPPATTQQSKMAAVTICRIGPSGYRAGLRASRSTQHKSDPLALYAPRITGPAKACGGFIMLLKSGRGQTS